MLNVGDALQHSYYKIQDKDSCLTVHNSTYYDLIYIQVVYEKYINGCNLLL